MVKEQWWSFLQRLVEKYESGAEPAISAVLAVCLPKGATLTDSIVQVTRALSDLEGDVQKSVIKSAIESLSTDVDFLPHVIVLLFSRLEGILEPLAHVQRMGLSTSDLEELALRKLQEASDPRVRETFEALKSIGQKLKQFTSEDKSVSGEDTEEDGVMHGPRNPIVDQILSSSKISNEEKPQEASQPNLAPTQPPSGYASPGDVIGNKDWRLTELLGRGGMGSVWKAVNYFQEQGALKLMLPHLVSNDRLIKRFQLEIRAVDKIRHPNVVKLSDWGRDRSKSQERWYFVTDFIEGNALSKILQHRGSLSLENTKKIFLKIAEGLHAAHGEGVIHRDIKPGNIMIRPSGDPVIIDFGIARQLEDPSMTQTHERVLTLQFASPEQLYGEPVSPQSDVFSLAATMSFALHPDPKRQRPQFEPDKTPEAFHWILEQCLNYKPENRPKDMMEFVDLLSQVEFKNGVITNFPRKPVAQESRSNAGVGLTPQSALSLNGSNSPVAAPPRLSLATSPEDAANAALEDLKREVYHYHGPTKQQKYTLAEIVELVKAAPRDRHLVWQKGWSEWKPWYKVKLLKEYVQALKENQTQALALSASQSPSQLTPFSKHTIEVMGMDHTLIAVPPGSFWMGNHNVDAESDERPRHRAHLSRGFLMAQTAMTQEFFEAVIGRNPSQYKYPNHPVERVSWNEIVRWCNNLSEQQGLKPAYDIKEEDGKVQVVWNQLSEGYRLPTEAEWEYAARAGSNFTYSGSNRPDEVAWFGASRRREGQKTYKVGDKQPNGWGFYDMSGNVWEWCWGDMREYTGQDVRDPIGKTDTAYRICRGGSNYLDARQTRCSYRMRYLTSYRSLFVGFRVARSLG